MKRTLIMSASLILFFVGPLTAGAATLLGYWDLNETTGPTVYDSSGNNLNGTIAGDALLGVSGPSGYAGLDSALNVNGTGYVALGSPASLINLTNNLTIEAWINPSVTSGVQRIFSSSNRGVSFGINGNGLRFTTFGVKDYNLTTSAMILADQWTHVAAVMGTNNSISFYVNGNLRGTVTHTAPGLASIGTYQIGTPSPGHAESFHGSIDEVAVYSGTLTTAEILAHYQSGVQGLAAAPSLPYLETFDAPASFYGTYGGYNSSTSQIVAESGIVKLIPSAAGDVYVTRPAPSLQPGETATIQIDVGGTTVSRNIGVRIGENTIVFHPGHDPGGAAQGAFRIEGPGGFANVALPFLPAVNVLHHLTVQMHADGLFEVQLADGGTSGLTYSTTFTNPASVGGGIGFHRGIGSVVSETALFDNFIITAPGLNYSETFDTNTPSLTDLYDNFTDGRGRETVADGRLVLSPVDTAGYNSTTTIPGIRPKASQTLEIEVDLGSSVSGQNIGFRAGENTITFHPGHDPGGATQGAFRIDGPNGFGNVGLPFLPAPNVMHHLKILASPAGKFYIQLTDGSNPANVYTTTFTNAGSIGGALGPDCGPSSTNVVAYFDNLSIRTPTAEVFHYSFDDATALPAIVDENPLGHNATAAAGAALSTDVPTIGVPEGAGNRSLDTRLGAAATADLKLLDNALIAEAGGFTMETWFKYMGGGTALNKIIDYAGTEFITLNTATNEVYFRVNSSADGGSFGIVAPGQWHYAAVVFDTQGAVLNGTSISGIATLYFDGEAVATTGTLTITNFGDGLNRPIGIGRHPMGGELFQGLIYEPRVSLGALDAAELNYVPEPGTLVLLVLGIAGVSAGLATRKRRLP